MHSNLRRTWLRGAAALAIVALSALTGCGREGSPTMAPAGSTMGVGPSSESAPATSTTLNLWGAVNPGNVGTIPVPISTPLVEDIRVALPGGTTLIRAGSFTLEIPKGALAAPTLIILRDRSGDVGHVQVELLPHGLQFLVPVRLTMAIPEGYDPRRFLVFYVENEGTPEESWLPLETCVSEKGGEIETWLEHFSTYAPGTLEGKAGWGPVRRHDRIDQGGQ